MSKSITSQLILKDLYLFRWFMVGAVGGSVIALVAPRMLGVSSDIGLILMLTSIGALAAFIAIYGIMIERKEKSLLFIMSLPVSGTQYAFAKVAAALIAFLVPWLLLFIAVVSLTLGFDSVPNGRLPSTVALMMFLLANFSLLVAVMLTVRSEAGAVAGILLTNIFISVYMTTVYTRPGITQHLAGEAIVWSPTVLGILGGEVAVIVVSLAFAFFIQSRRKDFA